jgi:hypothetical protein
LFLKTAEMISSDSARLFLVNKFPELNDKIDSLYDTNPAFRDLCSEYLLCIRRLNEYQKGFDENYHEVVEFANVRKDLENELQDFILNKK